MKTIAKLTVVPLLWLLCSCSPPARLVLLLKSEPVLQGEELEAFENRLRWNEITLEAAYNKVGRRDKKWDRLAQDALAAFARARAYGARIVPELLDVSGEKASAALKAGCEDPMVRYLALRFGANQPKTPQALEESYQKVHGDMMTSEYPPLRKFYAAIRTSETLFKIHGLVVRENSASHAAYYAFVNAQQFLEEFVQDTEAPIDEVDEALHAYWDCGRRMTSDLQVIFGKLEPALLQALPNSHLPYLLKGEAHQFQAWGARGRGTSEKVTEEGWKKFKEHLDIAEAAFEQAWKLNPKDVRIPNAMLKLEMGQGKGRARLEEWFQRAMDLDPENREACGQKLLYLEPKWFGSPEEMLQFGRQCVASEKWKGSVPLTLVDAHYSLAHYVPKERRSEYWQQPAVWSDIETAYAKFFTLYPDEVSYRPYFARLAFWCGKWDVVEEQLRIMEQKKHKPTEEIDGYAEMLAAAKARAGK